MGKQIVLSKVFMGDILRSMAEYIERESVSIQVQTGLEWSTCYFGMRGQNPHPNVAKSATLRVGHPLSARVGARSRQAAGATLRFTFSGGWCGWLRIASGPGRRSRYR